jgi:hypothetical protein
VKTLSVVPLPPAADPLLAPAERVVSSVGVRVAEVEGTRGMVTRRALLGGCIDWWGGVVGG